MIGIQRANPDAFIKGNINQLKAGAVLRLPTAEEVADISRQDAVSSVATQNRSWKTGDTSPGVPTEAPLDATVSRKAALSGSKDEARLSIAGTGAGTAGSEGTGEGAGSAALESDLAAAQEDLDKTQRENEELNSRLQDMETKLATMQRLLELKEDQLAALQGGVADTAMPDAEPLLDGELAEPSEPSADREQLSADGEQPSVEGEQPLADGEQPSVDVEQPAVELEQPSAELEAPVAAAEPIVAEAEQPAAGTAPAPVVETEQDQAEGLLAQFMSNPLYWGSAAGVAVILLLLAMRARSKQDDEPSALVEDEPSDELADVSLEAAEEDQPEAAEQGVADEPLMSDEELGLDADQAVAEEEAQDEAAPVQSETGDPIAEADIYIAYGRYGQAKDLLKSAIAQAPSSALYVKLLEVCVEAREKEDFQAGYQALQGLGDEDAIVQVKEMLSTVDGVSDWLEGVESAPVEADLDSELSLDEDAEEGFDLDLDLDEGGLDLGGNETAQFDAVSLDEGDNEASTDLDLGLDESLSLEETEESLEDMLDLAESSLDIEDSGLELDESSLELEESVEALSDASLELDEASLALDGSALQLDEALPELEETPAAAEEGLSLEQEGVDDLGLELGDLEIEGAAEAATEEGLDLDLDGDFDLDLDEMSAAADLGDLEAEFGDLDSAAELGELDVDSGALDATDELSIDLEEAAGDELSLEADELADELELSLEKEPVAELESVVEGAPVIDEAVEAPSVDAGQDEDFDFLGDSDEVATKLDLARAYIDMGDGDGAKDILEEVTQEGSDEQKQQASELLERL